MIVKIKENKSESYLDIIKNKLALFAVRSFIEQKIDEVVDERSKEEIVKNMIRIKNFKAKIKLTVFINI